MFRIVHLNDTEACPDRVWAGIAAFVGQARTEGRCDLLLHAGDVRLGAERGWELVRVLNHIGLDGLTVGNHDLDDGVDLFKQQIAALDATVLCSNLVGAQQCEPYRVYACRGIRVAVCGVTLEEMPLLQPDRNISGLRFVPPSDVLMQLLAELRPKVDAIVVLSHCGLETDIELARQHPDIDVIIGGHSHDLLTAPVRVGKTHICQAGAYGEHVGWISLDVADGLLSVDAGVVPTADLEPDVEVLGLIGPAVGTEGELVGYTTTDLRTEDYACETPLGNLMADLIRGARGADVALLRCSAVRNALPAGPIREVDLSGLLNTPDDRIACLTMTGHELVDILECGARESYYLLTASGAQVVYDGGRPGGERVVSVMVAGRPVVLEHEYQVACSEILARGAAGFVPLRGKPYELLDKSFRQVLAEHIRTVRTVAPALDGRLVVIGGLPRKGVTSGTV